MALRTLIFVICISINLFLINGCTPSELRQGDYVPPLTANDVNGNAFSLDSITHKIILIDFWASWCKPCRKQHPEMRAVYEKYQNQSFQGGPKGFEIVGVSFDDKKNNWVQAIDKDALPWVQISELKSMPDSSIPVHYKFVEIPTSYLIDETGKVIGKNLSPKMLAYELSLREFQ